MTWRRLPVRARITAAFAAVMTVLLTGIGFAVYRSTAGALLDELDSGLRFRAAVILTPSPGGAVERVDPALQERAEAFDQLVTRTGRVLRSSPGLPRTSILRAGELARLDALRFFERHVRGVADTARLLAVPVPGSGGREVLVVGASMSDRTDQLGHLLIVLGIGSPLAVALACAAAWAVAGLALRPVERMRRQAAAITASDLERRLELPVVRDELYRLAATLNDLLGRLAHARDADRRFLERASHELRTPLALLKTELDLALSRPRPAGELRAAIGSAAEEVDRLHRLADDLLVLARTSEGRLPVRREPTRLDAIVEPAVASFQRRAAAHGGPLTAEVEHAVANLDPLRVRQALDDLIDNALRHTPPGTAVHVSGTVLDGIARLEVVDDGPGFTLDGRRTGLGLEIAAAIAASHGGRLDVQPAAGGGARVVLTFAAEAPMRQRAAVPSV